MNLGNWGIGNPLKRGIEGTVNFGGKVLEGKPREAVGGLLKDTTGVSDVQDAYSLAQNPSTGGKDYGDAVPFEPIDMKHAGDFLMQHPKGAAQDVPGANDPGNVAAAAPTGGTQSAPGILENWFNQRATGTDPGWLYGTGRAEDAINRRYAASGGYNSSAANQSVSDMYSNAISQREGQLDALAGGASGEHQGRLDSMFKYGTGLAGAEASTAGGYDKLTADAQYKTEMDRITLMYQRGQIDAKTYQKQIADLNAAAGDVTKGLGDYFGKQTGTKPGSGDQITGKSTTTYGPEYPTITDPKYTPL